jgi:hypothetical protein
MKPGSGVALELVALAAISLAVTGVPAGWASAASIVVFEFLATYLIHCPAHYFMGVLLGIKFRKISMSRSTLARSLPPRLGPLLRLFVVPTLSTDRASMLLVSPARASAMYASGTVASVASAFLVAAAVTVSEPPATIALAWVFALGYFLFDALFSPRSGDLRRARNALAGP